MQGFIEASDGAGDTGSDAIGPRLQVAHRQLFIQSMASYARGGAPGTRRQVPRAVHPRL